MKTKIKNQLLMSSGEIVSELRSLLDGYRCWVAISAVSVEYIDRVPDGILRIPNFLRDKVPGNAKQIYTIRKVLVDSESIDKNWDLGESDVKYEFFEIAYTFDEIFKILKEHEVDKDSFVEPWNTDYPL